MNMSKTVTAKTIADNAPAKAEHVTANSAKADKPADDKAGPLVAIPSPALACAILDGAVGADEWAAFRGQIAKLVDFAPLDKAGMAALTGHLSSLLSPVFMAASFDGEWYKRTAKAYGKKEADARQNKAAAKIKMAINGALQRKSPVIFSLTNWAAGTMAIFDATDCPATLPASAKAAGFTTSAHAAAYKAARDAAIVRTNAQYDADKRMAAEKEAAAFVASKAEKLQAAQATALPPAVPASKAGKDTGEAMAGIAAIMAALDDKTADRIDTAVLDALAVRLSGYLTARHAADKAQAKARAKAVADKAAKAAKADKATKAA